MWVIQYKNDTNGEDYWTSLCYVNTDKEAEVLMRNLSMIIKYLNKRRYCFTERHKTIYKNGNYSYNIDPSKVLTRYIKALIGIHIELETEWLDVKATEVKSIDSIPKLKGLLHD